MVICSYCQSYQQDSTKIQQIQQNKIYQYTIMDDPKYHNYWFAMGCPSDDEEIKEEFYNPVIENISHTFITLALPQLPDDPDEKYERVMEYLHLAKKMVAYKYFSGMSCLFSFEFYSMEKKLKLLKENFHIHMLFKGKYKKFDRLRIIRDFSKKFKIEANFVDVKYHQSPELYHTRVEYVKGTKQSSKTDATEKDKEMRKELRLADFYNV